MQREGAKRQCFQCENLNYKARECWSIVRSSKSVMKSNANIQTLGDRKVADEKDDSARYLDAQETTFSQPNACVLGWERAEQSIEEGHAIAFSNVYRVKITYLPLERATIR